MRKVIIIFHLFTAILSNFAFANNVQIDSLRFSGHIRDLDQKNNRLEMAVVFHTADQFSIAGASTNVKPLIDEQSNFSFNLPNLGKSYQISISIFLAPKDNQLKRIVYSNMFFVEPRDNIKMDISLELDDRGDQIGNSILFSGFGANKYNLMWELQNTFFRDYFKDLSLLNYEIYADSASLDRNMSKLSALITKYRQKKSYLINKEDITPIMRKIINYEFGAYGMGLNNEWRFRCQLLYDQYPKDQQQIVKNYLRYKDVFYKSPDTIAEICSNYQEETLMKEIFELRISEGSEKVKIVDIYNVVKHKYTGAIRERLLGLILTNQRLQGYFQSIEKEVLDSLLCDVIPSVKLSYVGQRLRERLDELRRYDATVFNGEFILSDGKSFQLHSLLGKVILIDIWFNGCWGCADFHEKFKKIYPRFKDDENFMVLSLNVDKDRQKWQKGIESNLYSSKEYLQVTTGNWFDHPFMNYYGISGASYVMLLDKKGKPFPKVKNLEELAVQIELALKE